MEEDRQGMHLFYKGEKVKRGKVDPPAVNMEADLPSTAVTEERKLGGAICIINN